MTQIEIVAYPGFTADMIGPVRGAAKPCRTPRAGFIWAEPGPIHRRIPGG